MKIGILTLPISENYGGILQALALYRILEKQEHNVVLIYKEMYTPFWKELLKKILLKIPYHNFKQIKSNDELNQLKLERKKFHKEFIDKEIHHISQELYTKDQLEDFIQRENFDVIIVGSDQVWRKSYINDKYYKSYFLDFVSSSKVKKIAYAASFGTSFWEGKNDIEEISKLLQDFTNISVRENSALDICRNIFGCDNAINVLDPTMLMDKDFYINEIISQYDTNKIQKGGIVTYVLDEAKEKKEIIDFIQENLAVNLINHLKGFQKSKKLYSIPEWLASFYNAEFVVTDSFHGMVFSIIFEKDFVVIGNSNRGIDRFISLLSLLKLENRLICDVKDLKVTNLESIDYVKVNKILDSQKKKSKEFLNVALHK